jgi:hypothetical protein
MPRPSAAHAATALTFVGIALVVGGAFALPKEKGLGLALLLAGFAVVVLSSWISSRRGGGEGRVS